MAVCRRFHVLLNGIHIVSSKVLTYRVLQCSKLYESCACIYYTAQGDKNARCINWSKSLRGTFFKPRRRQLVLLLLLLYNLVTARNFEAHGTSKHTELRSARNFETHGTSKHTKLRNARNFEAHKTSKRTELRKARNFERHGTSKMSSKLLCMSLYLNPYYSSYLTT